MDVTLVFEKGGEKNYSCFVEEDTGKCGLLGYGNTAKQAEDDLFVARKEYIEIDGKDIPELNVIKREFDVGAFFDYYPLNITQFAKFANINSSQLRQYVSGQRRPSKPTLEKIEVAIRQLGRIFQNESCALSIN